MEDKIIKSNSEIDLEKDTLTKIQSFQKMYLQKEPIAGEVKANKYANNSKYLPISFLEMSLDEIFFGLWQTKNFQSRTVANEEVGSIELWFFHPIAKTWMCRIGAGAVQIQMKSVDKGGSGDITNIKDKITNTLTKDYPHLKAQCVRNACLSIGKSFGRDLNREFDDDYFPLIVEEKNKVDLLVAQRKIIDAIETYTGTDKEDIRKQCIEHQRSGKFDLEFSQKMASKLGIKL